jgi:transposase InsO family protein
VGVCCAADGTGQGWGGGAGHYHGRCWDRGVAGRLGRLGAQSGSGQ